MKLKKLDGPCLVVGKIIEMTEEDFFTNGKELLEHNMKDKNTYYEEMCVVGMYDGVVDINCIYQTDTLTCKYDDELDVYVSKEYVHGLKFYNCVVINKVLFRLCSLNNDKTVEDILTNSTKKLNAECTRLGININDSSSKKDIAEAVLNYNLNIAKNRKNIKLGDKYKENSNDDNEIFYYVGEL